MSSVTIEQLEELLSAMGDAIAEKIIAEQKKQEDEFIAHLIEVLDEIVHKRVEELLS